MPGTCQVTRYRYNTWVWLEPRESGPVPVLASSPDYRAKVQYPGTQDTRTNINFPRSRYFSLFTHRIVPAVRVLILTAGGSYRIFSCKYVPQIILIDRYSGIGTQKYLRYSKVPVLYRDCIGPTSRR